MDQRLDGASLVDFERDDLHREIERALSNGLAQKRSFIGRYISKDPIGLAGGLNPYAYAPNPNLWVDPLGLQEESADNVVLEPLPADLRPDGRPWGAGCGDAGTDKYVPDSFFGIVSFREACNIHDDCYGELGTDKLVCDNKLEENMKYECKVQLKGTSKILYPMCSLQGSFYGFAVRNFGQSAYNSAQEKAIEEDFWKEIMHRTQAPESEWNPIPDR
jgi:hypothetical protein